MSTEESSHKELQEKLIAGSASFPFEAVTNIKPNIIQFLPKSNLKLFTFSDLHDFPKLGKQKNKF